MIRVFVACSPREWLPARVLEFSIREHTTEPVSVVRLAEVARPIPVPRLRRNRARTPFSFQRFLIPELCGWEGRAIYLDADMQVFTDIEDLWNTPLDGNDVLAVREGTGKRPGQFSVMVLDCASLDWRVEEIVAGLDAGLFTYDDLMGRMCVAHGVGRTIDPAWNSLERYVEGETRLLHYTDMNTQPWVTAGHAFSHLWIGCLKRALAAGFITPEEIEREIRAGNVRPSLRAELAGRSPELRDLQMLDAAFEPPFRSIPGAATTPWSALRRGAATIAQRGLARLRKATQA